jgi:hypothetical protein
VAVAGELMVNQKPCRREGPSPAPLQRRIEQDHMIVQHAISLTIVVLSREPPGCIGAANLRAVAYARK